MTSALELDADEESLYSNCFAALGFRKSQFSRLLRSATFKVAGENDLLTVQGEPIYKLYVPISGGVEVRSASAMAADGHPSLSSSVCRSLHESPAASL